MKITVFNGSPNAERGNTHIMVDALLQGAQEAGAEVENVFLAHQKIRPCIACKACWQKTPGKCSQRDAMDELLPKVISSDIVGLATPVYVDNVTGMMKNFIDRLIPLGDPHWEKDEHGECRHVKRYDNPKGLLAISNCGYPEQSHFQVLQVMFRRMARNLSCELTAEIYRGGGGLLKSQEPTFQPAIEQYKQMLRKAGQEIAQHSRLSDATRTQLDQPLLAVPNYVDLFISRVNHICDEQSQKIAGDL